MPAVEPGALFTDLYQLNMASSYLRRGMVGPATFSLFVRALPENRGFLVAAGLEDCISYLEDLRFEEADLAYCRDGLGFDADTLDAFAALRFTGDVRAVPEGRVVLADEPLLEVTAPIAEAQLVETLLLNRITFQTALATKAARCVIAAGRGACVDFAARRTHGVDAAFAIARASAIAGFVATSNVTAARRYDLVAAGTMAHSYIEAFATEEEAFRAFAADCPGRTTFLVDTYDTIEGVRTAASVILDLRLHDREDARLGVRLDSGDLLALSIETRRILDEAGLHGVRIFASGGLDEHEIDRLLRAGAPIDAFGIGTRLGVSADAPALDSAYKLVEYADRPVMKLSTGKVTLPGAKQVFRLPGDSGDVIGLRDEPAPGGASPLLAPVMLGGRRVGPPSTIDEARARCAADVAALPEPARRLDDPRPPPVHVSPALAHLRDRTAHAIAHTR